MTSPEFPRKMLAVLIAHLQRHFQDILPGQSQQSGGSVRPHRIDMGGDSAAGIFGEKRLQVRAADSHSVGDLLYGQRFAAVFGNVFFGRTDIMDSGRFPFCEKNPGHFDI